VLAWEIPAYLSGKLTAFGIILTIKSALQSSTSIARACPHSKMSFLMGDFSLTLSSAHATVRSDVLFFYRISFSTVTSSEARTRSPHSKMSFLMGDFSLTLSSAHATVRSDVLFFYRISFSTVTSSEARTRSPQFEDEFMNGGLLSHTFQHTHHRSK
jgi:hypothetical protein